MGLYSVSGFDVVRDVIDGVYYIKANTITQCVVTLDELKVFVDEVIRYAQEYNLTIIGPASCIFATEFQYMRVPIKKPPRGVEVDTVEW